MIKTSSKHPSPAPQINSSLSSTPTDQQRTTFPMFYTPLASNWMSAKPRSLVLHLCIINGTAVDISPAFLPQCTSPTSLPLYLSAPHPPTSGTHCILPTNCYLSVFTSFSTPAHCTLQYRGILFYSITFAHCTDLDYNLY